MSEKLDKNSTNKINLLTLKEAATLASYSTAYLARLIKQNKIEGKQVDRQWYIDSNSLNIFLEDVAKAKKIQREKIRQERIAERNVIPLVVSDEVVRDELPKSEDISPFNLPALVGSVATVATFAFFFILGSGVHSYDYLAILDVSESLGDMSFLPEEDSTLKALAISSDGQTLLTSIKEHLWCGIEVVFLNDGRCLYLPVFEYAIAEPRKKTDQVTTTATSTVAAVENVNSGSGTTIINEYITNNPVVEVKETVIENRLVERFSTKENVTRQADELINSINELSISFETDLLTVNGELNAASTTIGGTLEASGFIASNRFVRAPYFVATDATATSTFAGALAVGTTTSNATLTVDGATYLASITAPASTSSLLYNLGGELYWAGSAIAGPSVGTWGTDGINVWRGSGNVGIGTTTPSQSLSVVGSGLITGGFGIGVATNTPGVLQTSGDALIGGNLTVMGNSTVFGNSTTIGTTTGGTLVINSRIASDLIPQINGTYNLGSPSLYWNDAYVDTLTVNNISAASTSIAGTQSETFTFNSDNASSDNEDINLIFYRGSVVPNALITWDSTADRFDINQPFFIQNDSSSTTIPTLQLAGSASQTSDIFKVNSFAGSSLFNITSAGRVGIGTTTPASKLDIWGNLQVGTSSASTLIVNTATGQVGINTSSPTSGYSLDVAGLAYASGGFYSNNFSSSWDGSASNPNFRRASDTNTGIFFPGADNIAITTGGTERFRIDSSGNVGIGTTSPASIFHVESAFPMVTLHDTSGVSGARFTTNGVSNPASPAFRFGVDAMASTLMTMLKNGNVGIGTTTPGRKLELYQTGSSNALMRLTSVPSSPGTSNESAMEFYTAATNNTTPLLSGRITSNFTGTSYTNTVLKFQNATTGGVLLDTMTLANGNVGIGTTNPGTMLHVTGTIQSGSPDSVAGTLIANGNGSGSSSGGSIWLRTATDHDTVIDRFQIAADANNFYVGTEDQSDLFAYNGTNNSWYFNHNGNVGIGITNPQNILQIQKDSTYSSESSAGLSVRSATADTELLLGTDAVNDIGYIQAMQDGTSWTTRALVLQPNGGKVGIGTTTPTTNLSVSGSTGIQTDFGGVVVEVIGRGDLGYGIVGTDTNHPLHLRTNNATRMVLDTSGNVGIGTTSPVAKFDIRPVAYSNNQANGILLGNTENNLWNSSIYLRSNESGSARLSISGPGVTDSLVINSSGNVGIGTTTPTEKLHILGSESNGSTATLRISSGLSSMLLDNNEIDTISSSLFLNSNVNGNVILATGGGNVGIGTTSPVSMLSVAGTGIFSGSAATPLVLERNSALSNVSIEFRNQTQSWYAGQGRVGAGNFSIGTSNDIGASGFLNITPAGNVGIGTTTPSEKLSINAGSISLFDAGGRAIELRHINNYGVRMFLDGATADLRFQTNNLGTYADALTIKRSNGYVGIGTSTPTYPLDIYTSTDGTISTRFTNASNGNSARTRFTLTNDAGNSGFINLNGSNFSSDPNTLTVAAPSVPGGHLILSAGGSELMRLAVGGNVGIGTTSPQSKLVVVQSNQTSTGGITIRKSNADAAWGQYINTDSSFNLAYGSESSLASTYLTVQTGTGNVGIGTTTPSNKLTVQGNAHITGALYDNNNSAGSNGMVLQSTGSGFNWVATSSLGISGGGGGGLAATDIDTCSELAAIISGETGTCGSLVLSASPTFTGTVNAAAATLSSTLTMSGSAANIALGSNFLSGDGGDEGISINTNGDFTFTGASGDSLFINLNEGSGYPTFFSSANTISLSANTEILDGFELSLSDEGNDRSAYLLVENNGATVFGNSAGDIALMPTGNVGIGTSTPGARLEIAGSASVSATVPAIRLSDTAGNPNSRNWEISNARGPYGSLAFLQSSTVGGVPTSANTRLLIDHNGNVGIGTTTPGEKLHVNGPTFIGPTVSSSPAGTLSTYGVYLSNAGYISMNRNNGTALYAGRSNDGTLVSFHSAGISQGSISVSGATLSYNAFTGSHYAHLDGVEAPEPGTVMSMTSNNVYQGNDPMISAEPIYGVVPSSIENDDRILGTYLSLTDPTKPYSNNIGEDYNPYLVSAVGNGFMWVVDSGEDIEVGDWLITASTTGHAKKDPKTHSVSHVIAKASESVVWDNITSTTVDGVKHVKIQVLFENFDRPNSIVLDGPVDNTTSSHTLLSFNDTTIWSRLAKLAASFVDGVLTLTKASIEYIRADFLEVRDGRFSEQLCVGDVCVDEDTFLALVGGASATSSDLTTSEGILCLGNTCIDEDGLRELMRENNVNVIDPNTLENQEDEEQQTGTSTNPVDNTTANGTTGTSSLPVINDSGIASSTATSTNDGTGTTATSTNNGTGGVTLDTTAPTVTLNGSGSLTLTVGDSYTEEGATATDDTDGDITSGIVISGTVDTSTAGTYMITYEVEDQAGNMAETTRTITVEEAPASNPETPPTEPVVVDPIPTP